MSNELPNVNKASEILSADCENCFALCCVALPYAQTADFACDKDAGTPCSNLQTNNRCGIHTHLRNKGFRGCAVYECFGAGQKVSQHTYKRRDWRNNPGLAKEMFDVFPIMQQLHEMLYYLNEALHLSEAEPIYKELQAAVEETVYLTELSPKLIIELDIPVHRAKVNELLLHTSELVRAKALSKKSQVKAGRRSDFIGANLKRVDLMGANLRGALLIAADLRESDMRMTDLIGADLRDADLSGANLLGSIFLTQAQVNSAKGDDKTKLPPLLRIPKHWVNADR